MLNLKKQEIMKTKLCKSNKFLSMLLLMSMILMSCNSCTKEEDSIDPDDPITGNEAEKFNASMAKLTTFNQPDEASEGEQIDESDPERESPNSPNECVVKTYKVAPGFDEMLTLDPSTDVIYPGAVLKGESIPTGEYIGISLDRRPITLSASLTNIEGSPVVTINDPKLSTVREGIKQILDQEVTGATAAKINYVTTQVYSEKHLEVAIGVNYRGAGKKVSANIDFNSSEYKNKFVLKFLQEYYTIDMDSPGSEPSDLFKSLPDVSALGSTSPVYVASVAYGRMVIYTIETNSNLTEVNTAFGASVGSSDGNIETEYRDLFNSSKIQALIIGGSGGDAAQTINGPADVYKFISEGGNYSKDSPGAPLSYKLRYIKRDFPIARQVLATEYPIRECKEVYQKFGIQLYGWRPYENGSEKNLEIYGDMSAKLYHNDSKKAEVKWHQGGDPAINWSIDDGFYEINEDNYDVAELKDLNLDEDDYVKLYANFYESDGSGTPDHFGDATIKIDLKGVPNNKTEGYERIVLNETSGNEMRVYYYVWRIDY